MTDPIADMLTRIRNSIAVGHEQVEMPLSKLREGIAKILVVEGYIDRYETAGEGVHQNLILFLRYGPRRSPVIAGLRRVSRPGHRVYRQAGEIPRVQGGLGVAVVSTSQGLLADREARRRRLGGEILCEVW
ncbi:MAG TPA: 30S ribosomal protein S8 [Acidimicrobiia bacterium]|nr:30S ribosomal protein S8 [Acidimicrobiia bacterium]HJU80307.1 30S ribosomal protein S8 [Acidimicrobiia bacterium]